MTPLWTPETLALAVLWGTLDDQRFRKLRRHVPTTTDVRELLAALETLAGTETAQTVRVGLARLGVTA